jgi:hypothetical protein
MKNQFIIFLLSLISLSVMSQVNPADSAIRAFIPNFSFSYQFPGGDLSSDFGSNATIGGGFFIKSKKNFIFSGDFNYIFGSTAKNEKQILSLVLTSSGHIIDNGGTYALYTVNERGFSLNARIGKIISALGHNPNSGVMLLGGIGYLQTFVNIDNQYKSAPQISGDYAKGYDHLRGGVNINEFVGYFFMGNSRVLNFYAGFEFFQAFTKSKRDYVFDMMSKDNNKYMDLFYGIRVGWMIPVLKRVPRKYYYY